MEWTAEGTLLAVRRHGESAAIVSVMTAERGRHAGVVRGGAGRRLGPVLQPGARLRLTWRARLTEHLGHFTVEPMRSRLGAVSGDRLGLTGLQTVCALLNTVLPEREAHPGLHDATETLLDLMPATAAWPLAYLRWELGLLESLGYGLDLSRCAVTGSTRDLQYVSPRTGRAVSGAAAGEHAAKLLPYPVCIAEVGPVEAAAVATALTTTGHFLAACLAAQAGSAGLPAARGRLVDLLSRERG